jgi:glycosyltransferase involved in cell wall biosynthesis
VALLTGGFDRPYVFGLSMALLDQGVCFDVIGSADLDRPEMHGSPQLSFLNLRGAKDEAGWMSKVMRVLAYYLRLIRYAATAKPRIFHILWNNKFEVIDRTLLMVLYRLLGKKIAFTAHNVNAGKRDGNDSLLNRLTLKMQYQLAHHIFVHTNMMKQELIEEFGVESRAVSVIPFGINNSVPDTDLTPLEAKRRLGLRPEEKTVLFFGAIGPYKGLECLLDAFGQLAPGHRDYRLIIAGQFKNGVESYRSEIQRACDRPGLREQILRHTYYIPDSETEVYFKAADVLVLPYTHIFQSGVLFLGYRFGLPVIATDVGSFREEIVTGETGFLCRPGDPDDLAKRIEQYFASDLFRDLPSRRKEIRDYGSATHSWQTVGEITRCVYADLLERAPS